MTETGWETIPRACFAGMNEKMKENQIGLHKNGTLYLVGIRDKIQEYKYVEFSAIQGTRDIGLRFTAEPTPCGYIINEHIAGQPRAKIISIKHKLNIKTGKYILEWLTEDTAIWRIEESA